MVKVRKSDTSTERDVLRATRDAMTKEGQVNSRMYAALKELTQALYETALIPEFHWERRDSVILERYVQGISMVKDDESPIGLQTHVRKHLSETCNALKQEAFSRNLCDVLGILFEGLTSELDMDGFEMTDHNRYELSKSITIFTNEHRISRKVLHALNDRAQAFPREMRKVLNETQELYKIFPKDIVAHVRLFMGY